MIEQYKCVYEGGTGEIVEKKSRFIATIIPISCEEEAISFIEQMKKKYWDARHNCSAYVIGTKNETVRCSDDGEPSQTAGKPMLDVLLNEGIHNCAVVVTRYFGGTLLGTGGLVRAYQAATKEGLNNSTIITKQYGKKLLVTTDYNGIGKLQYIASTEELTTLDTEYTDIVRATLLMPPDKEGSFTKKITEATNGKAGLEVLDEVYFATVNGEVLLFES
ncbi:MAG: YigZ family protein [Lachnospiraceae bacterium]|nr:YigZ family protein [Lachnospiraceae bacterium]